MGVATGRGAAQQRGELRVGGFEDCAAAWQGKEQDRILETAEKLAGDYAALRAKDPVAFARRAGQVLTQIPTYTIFGYRQLLKTNALARLMFVRSFDAYLNVPEAVRDLLEGSDIHVQMLAYRILSRDDDRARQMAVACQSQPLVYATRAEGSNGRTIP